MDSLSRKLSFEPLLDRWCAWNTTTCTIEEYVAAQKPDVCDRLLELRAAPLSNDGAVSSRRG